MPLFSPRFALLSILCSLAAQSLSPSHFARAAVIARSSTSHGNDHGLHQSQALFSSTWHSGIAVPNHHGGTYRIHRRQSPGAPPTWLTTPPRNGSYFNSTASTAQDCTPGTVAIMSPSSSSEAGKPLAYLYLVDSSNGTHIFDASETNKTQLCLADDPTTSSGTGSWKRLTTTLADTRGDYCATYDPDPSGPSPMLAERCLGTGEHEAHKSQTFSYDPSTGVIRPTVPQGDFRGTDQSSSSSLLPSAAPSSPLGPAGASASSSAVPSSTSAPASFRRRDNSFSSQSSNPQNVTLVFVPDRNRTSAAALALALTSTVTQTITVYSSSPSPVLVASATPSTNASSSATAAFATGLNVEIVGGLFSPPLSSAPNGGVARGTGSSSSGLVASSGSSYGMAAATPATPAPSSLTSSSASVNVADFATSTVSSYSAASSSTPMAFGGASASASGFVARSSTSPSSSADPTVASFAAQVVERRTSPEVLAESTDPYSWTFRADRR